MRTVPLLVLLCACHGCTTPPGSEAAGHDRRVREEDTRDAIWQDPPTDDEHLDVMMGTPSPNPYLPPPYKPGKRSST